LPPLFSFTALIQVSKTLPHGLDLGAKVPILTTSAAWASPANPNPAITAKAPRTAVTLCNFIPIASMKGRCDPNSRFGSGAREAAYYPKGEGRG
jgi:hypothetical protein